MTAKHWSTETYSVRERFSLGVVLLTTLYAAVLLSSLKLIDAPAYFLAFSFGWFVIVTVAQVAGRPLAMPRAVSMVAGAFYLSAWRVLIGLAEGEALGMMLVSLPFAMGVGALVGYFAGIVVASVFLIHDGIAMTARAKRDQRVALREATSEPTRESPFD